MPMENGWPEITKSTDKGGWMGACPKKGERTALTPPLLLFVPFIPHPRIANLFEQITNEMRREFVYFF